MEIAITAVAVITPQCCCRLAGDGVGADCAFSGHGAPLDADPSAMGAEDDQKQDESAATGPSFAIAVDPSFKELGIRFAPLRHGDVACANPFTVSARFTPVRLPSKNSYPASLAGS